MSFRNFFQPKAGRYGVAPAYLKGSPEGDLTANDTTTFLLGAFGRRTFIERCCVQTRVVPVDPDGTLLFTLYKYDASANAAVALTSGTLDLESLTALEATIVELLSGLTPTERIADEGDTLYCEVVSNSAAIGTQPAGLSVTVEGSVLE